nr:tetratricopeptide repeat protein [Candidatus Sigynarchaeota archaeon]
MDIPEELLRGMDALEERKWDDAIAVFQKITEADPQQYLVWYNLALALGNKAKFDDAIEACEKAVAVKPDFFKAWANLGWYASIKEDNEKAVAACKKTTELQPDYNIGWINLGVAMRVAGNLDGAITALKKAIELKGIDHEAWANLAICFDHKNDVKAWIEARDKAIKILPPDGYADSYNIVLKSRPGDPETMAILGMAQEANQKHEVALAFYQKATDKLSGFSLAWYGIAIINELKEMIDDAIEAFKRVVDLNPDAIELKWRLEAIAKRKFLQGVGDVFPADEPYAFLAGSGVSMYPPCSIPPIKDIARTLLEYCAPKEEVDVLLAPASMNLSMIIEQFKGLFDASLKFMEYFELPTVPNLVHVFLARAAKAGHVVITTNLDSMIERAMILLLGKVAKEASKIIVTKADFEGFTSLEALKSKYILVKLRGSMQNVITGEKCPDSLFPGSGMKDKSQDKKAGIDIEPCKISALQKMTSGRNLVIMGFADIIDFPVGPFIKLCDGIKSLIWIMHDRDDPSKSNAIVDELKAAAKFPVHLVKASVQELVEGGMWSRLINDTTTAKLAGMKPPPRPEFSSWLGGFVKPVEDVYKYALATSVYNDLGQHDAMLRCAQKGLDIAQAKDNIAALAIFSNYLGMFYDGKKDYDLALKHYQDTLTYAAPIDALQEKVTALTGMGKIYLSKGDKDAALKHFSDALPIANQINDLPVKAKCLSNIGLINEAKGNHDEALKNLEEALSIADKIGDFDAKVKRLNNLGLIYDSMGFRNKALQKYNDALKIADLLENLPIKASILNNIGAILKAKGDDDQAIKVYTDALTIDGKLQNKADMASELLSIGLLWQKKNDNKKALAFLERAAKLFEETGLKEDLESANKIIVLVQGTK